MKETLQVLSTDEAYEFMVGFEELTKSEKNLILYFLENNMVFKGTYTGLTEQMGYDDSYISEIHKACHRLEVKGILEIGEPFAWYAREIHMHKSWIETLIAIGKEKVKCTQKESSSAPLINWDLTR